MAQVTIRINGRPYEIGCEDGQEEHLTALADYIDRRVRELGSSVGQVGEARLLVMASLLIADELSDATGRLEALQGERQADGAAAEAESAGAAQRIEAAATRLESLSERLEAS
jgi:cell division protein ZapA